MDVRRTLKLWCAISVLMFPLVSRAKLVQVIHTNDLHSHMDYAGSKPDRGGYAAVKNLINLLRLKAKIQGIPTLVLDAGDFSEGTHYFLADHGVKSWEAMDEIGYDAVALGNHDYQVGNVGLDYILKAFRPKFNLVAANYEVENGYPYAKAAIKPYVEFDKGGIKIAVLGLTTNELFYRWTAKPGGNVLDPTATAKKHVTELKKRNHFVFALTHLGTSADAKLLIDVPSLDLVVGGHSHDALFKPVYIPRAKNFGINVQAGEHGKYVGDMLLDLQPGVPPRVVRYKLVEVNPLLVGQDWSMLYFVHETRKAIETRFGDGWLDEVIGHSATDLERPLNGTTKWSSIYPRVFRKVTGADMAWDVGEFYGPSQAKGDITREKLIRFFPRVFDIFNPNGWTVWTFKLSGKAIVEIIKGAAKVGFFFNLDGLTYRAVTKADGTKDYVDFKIGGQNVAPLNG
ncbi:MAG: metallophosphoesterase, partial [Bdellovibrionia bacterium]